MPPLKDYKRLKMATKRINRNGSKIPEKSMITFSFTSIKKISTFFNHFTLDKAIKPQKIIGFEEICLKGKPLLTGGYNKMSRINSPQLLENYDFKHLL